MPKFNDDIKAGIRLRFVEKFDNLIAAGKANSYREICLSIGITPQDFNQVKSGNSMPTLEMLYNLQETFKISTEHIMFVQPPRLNLVLIKTQLNAILDIAQSIEMELAV